jgi:hypothetical protein
MIKPVKHSLAYTVRSGSQSFDIRYLERRTLPLSSDDADLVYGMAWRDTPALLRVRSAPLGGTVLHCVQLPLVFTEIFMNRRYALSLNSLCLALSPSRDVAFLHPIAAVGQIVFARYQQKLSFLTAALLRPQY